MGFGRTAVARLEAELAATSADLAALRERLDGGDTTADRLAEEALATARNATEWVGGAEQLAGRALAGAEDAAAAAGNAGAVAERAEVNAARALAEAEDAAATARLALDTVREVLLPARVAAYMAWLRLAPPASGPTISIVLPTRDRPELLPRAVASAMEQEYEDWELVVVDDGDTDAVASVLADVEDERIVAVEGPRSGLGAARNAGLEHASGEVVCYLDDDNVMHPLWLAAVAHVFGAQPEVDLAYGVSIAEHRVLASERPDDWWPGFWQLPWSREALLEQNLTDAGALAHRCYLPNARFDEQLETGEDWDLLLRLTVDRSALAIPALSHAYTITGSGRMSLDPGHRGGLEAIRRRHAES